MDPIATILARIDGMMSYDDACLDLREWYRRKGWRPTLAQIEAEAKRRSIDLPKRWRQMSRTLGAKD